MFSKSLILVLLGCALALAKPVQDKERFSLQPGNIVNTFSSWLQTASNNVQNIFKQALQPFRKAYNSLVAAGKNVNQYSREKYEELRAKYHEITDKTREKLSQIENNILVGTISNLQKAVGFLNSRLGNSGDQFQQGANQIVQSGQEAVNQLSQWQNSVNGYIHPELMGSGQYVDQFGQQVQGAIGNGMGNIQGNFDQWMNNAQGYFPMNGFGMGGQIFDQFGNQVQGFIGDNVNNAQDNINQFNQFLPSGGVITNKLGGGINEAMDFLNDGRQTMDNMGQQLNEAVGGEVNNARQRLEEWENEVNNFLATGMTAANKLGQQVQAAGQDAIGQAQDFISSKKPDNGMFGKLGQNMGASIGGGVDKVTDGVGGLLHNVGSIFGK